MSGVDAPSPDGKPAVGISSLAAEIQQHAQYLDDIWTVYPGYYNAAVRADLSTIENYENSLIGDYYDLNSEIVQAQASAHGVY